MGFEGYASDAMKEITQSSEEAPVISANPPPLREPLPTTKPAPPDEEPSAAPPATEAPPPGSPEDSPTP